MNRTVVRLSWLAIFTGIILRASQFFYNRSLWFDEALVSLNIVQRSFFQLFESLNYNQGAPVGFLIIEKLLVTLFGQNDLVLRVFPFACSIISLFLFYKLCQLYLLPRVIPIALLIFSLVEPLIYYSSEVKQYSSDVFITILLLVLAKYFEQDIVTPKKMYSFIAIGALSIWFSHPAIFVLIGTTITLYSSSIVNNQKEKTAKLKIISLFFILNFALLYYSNLRNLNKDAIEFFGSGSFTPLPFDSQWLYNKFLEFFYFIEINKYWLPHIVCLVGVYSLFKKGRGSFFILASPILVSLLLSGFHLYPFTHRLLMFLIPIIVIFMVAGVDKLIEKTWGRFSIITVCLISLFIYYPSNNAYAHLLNPRTSQEIKACLDYIKQNQMGGDILYLHSKSQYQFKFYAKQFGFNDELQVDPSEYSSEHSLKHYFEKPGYITIVQGIAGQPQDIISDLEKLKGQKRAWVLFSHFSVYNDDSRLLINYLDQVGRRLESLEKPGAYGGAKVYLYDLSQPLAQD